MSSDGAPRRCFGFYRCAGVPGMATGTGMEVHLVEIRSPREVIDPSFALAPNVAVPAACTG